MNTTTGRLYGYETRLELERLQIEACKIGQEVVPVSSAVAEIVRAGQEALTRQQRRLQERKARKAARR